MFILLLSLCLAPGPLVGAWTLEGAPFAVLNANGTGVRDGETFRWSANGRVMTVVNAQGMAQIPYRLRKDQLIVVLDGKQLTLQRAGKGAPAGARPSAAAPGGGSSGPLAQLLLSSAWCSFRYNKVTGYSSQSRAVFRRDGSWSRGGRAEGYSSGYGGTFASQRDSRSGGRWQARGMRLFLSDPPQLPQLTEVRINVKRNSNGRPIIVADGVEYVQCR